VRIVLDEKRHEEYTATLKDVKEWLSKLRFVQTDPSHIINKKKLTGLKPVNRKWMALLGDKIMVPVSETHLEELQKILMHIHCKQYLKNLFGGRKPEMK
jgi:DNA-binding LytR/AlgR family response regulator